MRFTRRNFCAGATTLGAAALGGACGSNPEQASAARQTDGWQRPGQPGRSAAWAPAPDKTAQRDLKPGNTPIRLAGYIYLDDTLKKVNTLSSVGEAVQAMRKQGLSSAITNSRWLEASESQVSELRAALREADMVIFEVQGYRNFIHPDQNARQEHMKYLAKCLEAADRVGCPMVGTVVGSRSPVGVEFQDNYNPHPDNWTLETWNMIVGGIKQILKDTSGVKAAIGIEAQVTTTIDGPVSTRNLLDDVGDQRLKVNLDPTNMVHLYNYFRTTDLVNECFDLLGEDIYGCHAKDTFIFPHTQTVHVQEVCPGRGVMDYETYLVRLSRMEWARTLLPEHIPQDQFAEAYAYIRKVAAKVGVQIKG